MNKKNNVSEETIEELREEYLMNAKKDQPRYQAVCDLEIVLREAVKKQADYELIPILVP